MKHLVVLLVLLALVGCDSRPPLTASDATAPVVDTAATVAPSAVPPTAENIAPTAEVPTAETMATVSPPPAPGDGSGVALPAPSTFDALPGWVSEVAALLGPEGDAAAAVGALTASGFSAEPSDWQRADLTGDGGAEWIVRVRDRADAEAPASGPPGTIVVARSALPAEILYLGSFDDAFASPTLLSTADLTGDGVGDLVYEFTTCGANTCWQYYRVASWHGGTGVSERLTSAVEPVLSGYGMTYADAAIEDRTGDGVLDLVLYGGTAGSVGAGPQRARTEVWAFDGNMMALAETAYDASPLRYFRLLDANAAFDAGDYAAATTLYTEARDDEALETHGFDFAGSTMDERDAIRQYAAFRLILIALLQDDTDLATERLAWLEGEYPGSAIATAGAQLRGQYAAVRDVPTSCAVVRDTLTTSPDATGPLVYMGYTNPELTPETLCPVE